MPLITFPWLFEKELGRIATGIDISDDLENLGLANLVLAPPSKRKQGGNLLDFDDYITQEDGLIVHRGEELDLFRQGDDSDYYGEDDYGEEDDDEEARYTSDDHLFMNGRSGEVATEFDMTRPTPEHVRGGTGVEDVVPRTVLEGLVDPQHAATIDHESRANDCHGQLVQNSLALLIDDSVQKPNPQNVHGGFGFTGNNAEDSYFPELAPLVASDSVVDDMDSGVEEVVDFEVKDSALQKLARNF